MAWVRWFGRGLFWLVAFVAVLYVCDFIIWRIRVHAGLGISHVTVGMLQVETMKGNKDEYFPDGTTVVDCSISLFPQTGAGPCWYVESHRTIYER